MHRTVTITAPAHTTDALTQALLDLPGVVSLVVHRGASRKPPGDSVVVQCLNREVDAVLRQARAAAGGAALSVVTAEATSITDPSAQDAIDSDRDEAPTE